jgi:sulfate/thiosulfate transport system substrate-binding protein
MKRLASWLAAVLLLGATSAWSASQDLTLLNASYDPTREFYQDINAAFARSWKEKTGQTVLVRQSHAGSAKQARAVMDGLEADVVTLALGQDIDVIAAKTRLLPAGWQSRLPHQSAPYTSVIVFLVRQGNPKQIKDWDDLVKPGLKVITPNPKTSGGARWNYLAAYGFALKRAGGQEDQARRFVEQLFHNVPALDTGARAATTTFVQRKVGDVLVAWENEALLAMKTLAPGRLEVVYPSVSILAEPTVAWVDGVVKNHGTASLARAYLEFLYTETGQEIAARHYYRPRLASVREKFKELFPKIEVFTVDAAFGGWARAHQTHFAEGALFDRICAGIR